MYNVTDVESKIETDINMADIESKIETAVDIPTDAHAEFEVDDSHTSIAVDEANSNAEIETQADAVVNEVDDAALDIADDASKPDTLPIPDDQQDGDGIGDVDEATGLAADSELTTEHSKLETVGDGNSEPGIAVTTTDDSNAQIDIPTDANNTDNRSDGR